MAVTQPSVPQKKVAQPNAIASILSRLTTQNANKSMPVPAASSFNMPVAQQMPNAQSQQQFNPYNVFGNQSMDMNQMAQQGFDYFRNSANQQSELLKKMQEEALQNQMRQIESQVTKAINGINENYYLDNQNLQQDQVNRGLNAGIEADQDLRLALGRQKSMSGIYEESMNQMGSIESQRKASEIEREIQANQSMNQQMAQYGDFIRNVTNDNRSFAMDEAMLMGNYVPYEARGLVETVLRGKSDINSMTNPAQQQQSLASINDARIKLAAMGVNVDQIGKTATFDNSMSAISRMNKTMDGKTTDMALAQAIAQETGKFVDPQVQSLINTLLQTKQSAEIRGKSTPAERDLANQIRGQLSSMGYDINKIAGANIGYSQALDNARKLATPTMAYGRQQQDFKNENAQNTLNSRKVEYDYTLGREANTIDRTKVNNDFVLGKEQISVDREKIALDRQLGRWDYSLGLAEMDWKKAQTEIDMAKLTWDTSSESDKQQYEANTNAVIGDLMGMSRDEAIASFGKHYKNWIENGVDVVTVMKTLGLDRLLKPTEEDEETVSNPLDPFSTGK